MTFYKDYQNSLLDRMDLKTSVYLAALDVQYCCDLPYLWCFTFDSTGEVIYGRNFDDLLEWFEQLRQYGFTEDHRIYIFLNDLSQFFCYTKKYIDYDVDMIAKTPSQILQDTFKGLIFRDFMQYTEKDIDKYIWINDINAKTYHQPPTCDELSSRCELTDEETEYCSRRVLEISRVMRQEVNMIYQGNVSDIKLTRTARIESLLSEHLRRTDDEEKSLYWLIYHMNPISSQWGRDVLLEQLRKAFFGGTTFFEDYALNKLINNVFSADLTSAYCGEFFLSKFPMSRFKVLDVPDDYNNIFTVPYYSRKALLVTFEATDVELKKGEIAVIPSALRHYYIDLDNEEEKKDALLRAQGLKLQKSRIVRMTLNDIDFKLFCQSYKFNDLKVTGVLGARYGYLPDYVLLTVAELYKNKRIAKEKRNELEQLGLLDELQEEIYDDSKSSIARLYGIFTKSPVVCQYVYDKEKRDIKLVSSNYLLDKHKFRPVVYQWGVWTVSHVRKKLCDLRRTFRDRKIKTISGDTDCLNYTGNAIDIISEFNEKVNAAIARRCKAIGIDPADMKDLGTLEVKKYKLYRLTGLKQYAVVKETDKGDEFEPKCGGADKEMLKKYFREYSPDPARQIDHFRLGLTIPADEKPRKLRRQCNISKKIDYIDRDGNRIKSEVPSYQVTEYHDFQIFNVFSALGDKKSKITGGEIAQMLPKVSMKTPERTVKKK